MADYIELHEDEIEIIPLYAKRVYYRECKKSDLEKVTKRKKAN